jgi:aminopeptidase N
LHNNAPVNVYTPLREERKGQFALEVAIKSVKHFSEYFGIVYVLPKLDLIAVPVNDAEVITENLKNILNFNSKSN